MNTTAEFRVHVPPAFQGLCSDKPIHIYTRNLPHWRQEGASYFVTFRQEDSIPQQIWQELQDEVRRWRERAGEEGRKNGGVLSSGFIKEWDRFHGAIL